jgi:glycosyltransferase involved in cell wall biosynthesis
MISVVMASYLGEYRKAAKDREKKIIRAVKSVLNQTIPVELVLIADGCEKTVEIISREFSGQVNGYWIDKQPMWSGRPRNVGIGKAQNDIICYCDIDDHLEKDHCEKIYNNFSGDWVWFDDLIYRQGAWIPRKCNIEKKGMCGTSNLAHKKIALWLEKDTYAHDWNFIYKLKRASKNYKYIGHGGYCVAHIPGRYDI